MAFILKDQQAFFSHFIQMGNCQDLSPYMKYEKQLFKMLNWLHKQTLKSLFFAIRMIVPGKSLLIVYLI